MSKSLLYTFCETGAILDIGRQTVADLVRVYGLKPKIQYGKGKGLSVSEVCFLADKLGVEPNFDVLAVA